MVPVIAFWLGPFEVYVKLIPSFAVFFIDFIAIGYISKTSVPKALEIGYFKSFVEPVGKALEADGWIEYKDSAGKDYTDMKQLHARLEIVLPEDLSVKDKNSKNGLFKLQETVNAKTLGTIHLTKNDPDGKKIHFDLENDQGTMSLVVFDVPNTLNPLRWIQCDEVSGIQPTVKRDELAGKRAKQALKEFSEELEWSVSKSDLKTVSFKKGCIN